MRKLLNVLRPSKSMVAESYDIGSVLFSLSQGINA